MSQFGSQFHGKPFRKKEGNGKAKKKFRDKRRSESGGFFAKTTLSESDHLKSVRGRGSNKKNKLQYAANVNLLTTSVFPYPFRHRDIRVQASRLPYQLCIYAAFLPWSVGYDRLACFCGDYGAFCHYP